MKLNTILTTLTIILVSAATSLAQQPERPTDPQDGKPRQGAPSRQGPLGRLGLNKEQAEKIRTINRERRPAMEAAVKQLREANRLLDEAVYAESADQGLVNSRISEVQKAQAEVTRLRTLMEFEIRSVLTPGQLNQFRQMRLRRENRGPEGPGMRTPRMPNRPQRRQDGGERPPPRRI